MFNPTARSQLSVSRGVSGSLRIIFLAVTALFVSLAHADEYADVNVLIKNGKLGDALAKADQYLAGKPRDPQMRFIKGVIQTEAGKPSDAITTFTQITQDYPELPEPYNNLAVLYAGQSQFDKARAALEMAIRTNPSYATAHENLGDVYAKLASQAYTKALQLDNSNTAVQPKLALIRTLFAPESRVQKSGASAPASSPVATSPVKAPVTAAAPPAAKTPAVIVPAPVVAPPAPAVPKPTPPLPTSAVNSGVEKDVEAAVRAWAAAWSAKDMGGYLGSYGKEFDTPGKQSRKSWEDERRVRITEKSNISVKLENLAVTITGSKASAKFRQSYSADSLNVTSRKTLNLVKVSDRWVIVRESTGG